MTYNCLPQTNPVGKSQFKTCIYLTNKQLKANYLLINNFKQLKSI